MDARDGVRAVLERVLLAALWPNAEDPCARASEDQHQDEGAVRLHGTPQVPVARKRPPMKASYRGVEPTSKAAATST